MRALVAAGALLFALHGGLARAVPLSPEDLAAACADADGLAHCGRLIEEIQMKRLPNLAAREGDTLHVTLYPNGRASFTDTNAADGGRSYSLWDYLDALNAAVLYVTRGDNASFMLLQRVGGRSFELPAEPKLSPDRQRLATADFCASHCSNEVAVWRIARDGVRKELAWSPGEAWSDATVRWKAADALVIEYTRGADTLPRQVERRLDALGWTRLAQP